MIPVGISQPLMPPAGGDAPWPAESPRNRSKATAQDYYRLALVFVAAILFAGAVVVARAALEVASSSPSAPLLPAYLGQDAGGRVLAEGR